jgi:predicted site-specific integrase-resolvase
MLDAYQTPTGTVVIRDPQAERQPSGRIALYARVSSIDQKSDLDRQMQRLKDYADARGYTVATEVTEIASDFNDMRRNFSNCLQIPVSEQCSLNTKTEELALGEITLSHYSKRKDATLKPSSPPITMMIWSMFLSV